MSFLSILIGKVRSALDLEPNSLAPAELSATYNWGIAEKASFLVPVLSAATPHDLPHTAALAATVPQDEEAALIAIPEDRFFRVERMSIHGKARRSG